MNSNDKKGSAAVAKNSVSNKGQLRYRSSLYVAKDEALFVKTCYEFVEDVSQLCETVVFMKTIETEFLKEFTSENRVDRMFDVQGVSGTFTLPCSRIYISIADSRFYPGGIGRSQGSIKMIRDAKTSVYTGVISVADSRSNVNNLLQYLTPLVSKKKGDSSNKAVVKTATASAPSTVKEDDVQKPKKSKNKKVSQRKPILEKEPRPPVIKNNVAEKSDKVVEAIVHASGDSKDTSSSTPKKTPVVRPLLQRKGVLGDQLKSEIEVIEQGAAISELTAQEREDEIRRSIENIFSVIQESCDRVQVCDEDLSDKNEFAGLFHNSIVPTLPSWKHQKNIMVDNVYAVDTNCNIYYVRMSQPVDCFVYSDKDSKVRIHIIVGVREQAA